MVDAKDTATPAFNCQLTARNHVLTEGHSNSRVAQGSGQGLTGKLVVK